MLPTFEEFECQAMDEGYDQILEREWAAGAVLDEHIHPFALKALVVRGEMWLTVGDEIRHLLPGDTFALERNARHAERYGADGATYWVARRT